MQATATTRTTTRIAKLAASLALAGGLVAGAVTSAAAGVNAPQFEPLDGGGGGAFARHRTARSASFLADLRGDPSVSDTGKTGVWRGGHFVGFQPE